MILEKYFNKQIKKIKNETPYFKDNYYRYYTKEFRNGLIEFWAYPTATKYRGEFTTHSPIVHDGPIYLGKCEKGELTKPEEFYGLPMPIQRAALRLYKTVGVYE